MAKIRPYINREISWLMFNERVLDEALNTNNPLFERLKFVSIFCSNLDEFYMVRVGSLNDQRLLPGVKLDVKTHMSPADQLNAIFEYTAKLIPQKDQAYSQILKELGKKGLSVVSPEELSGDDEKFLSSYFKREIMPFISPFIIDKRHPFPFLENMARYIGVHLAAKGKYVRFGIIPVSHSFPNFVRIPGDTFRICLTPDIILHYAEKVFKKYTVKEKTIFKIVRNADIDVQEGLFDEDIDFRDTMKKLLKARKKLCPVRLDLHGEVSAEFKKYLLSKLQLEENQAFVHHSPLDLKFPFAFEDKVRERKPKLLYDPLTPHEPKFLDAAAPILPQVREKDVLLSYPFESMSHFIKLLNEAAEDPYVVSIKITLYRVAKNSKVIDALIKANDNGKEVFAVVELRARFDEQNNIDWSDRLEEAGVHLSYGLDDYKTHSKICLITRKTPHGIEHITQIGTGNYNEKTAKQYTDYCLITANEEIGRDASEFFTNMSLGETTRRPHHLLIAPHAFRSKILEFIDEEIAKAKKGRPCSVILKINSLTDKPIIDKLIEASQAGVPTQLIVRGICCLRSGIKGLTDHITVISIVGRYLEHSRVYSFGLGDEQKLYISSGDMMTRSTQTRVEIGVPIFDPDVRDELNHMLQIQLADNVNARIQQPDGTYARVKPGEPAINSQRYFFLDERYQKKTEH